MPKGNSRCTIDTCIKTSVELENDIFSVVFMPFNYFAHGSFMDLAYVLAEHLSSMVWKKYTHIGYVNRLVYTSIEEC